MLQNTVQTYKSRLRIILLRLILTKDIYHISKCSRAFCKTVPHMYLYVYILDIKLIEILRNIYNQEKCNVDKI